MFQCSYLILCVLLCVPNSSGSPFDKKKAGALEGERGKSRGLATSTDLVQIEIGSNSQTTTYPLTKFINNDLLFIYLLQNTSSRFYGALNPFSNPYNGFGGSPFGGFGMGAYPSNAGVYPPYASPYGYLGGPMNYGGFYPSNPGYFGNTFGGYSTTQQQQQQQVSHSGSGGTGIGGFQPPFAG